jgi:hypothetical protein
LAWTTVIALGAIQHVQAITPKTNIVHRAMGALSFPNVALDSSTVDPSGPSSNLTSSPIIAGARCGRKGAPRHPSWDCRTGPCL